MGAGHSPIPSTRNGLRGASSAVVLAGQGAPADGEQVHEHPRAIAQEADFRGGVVVPSHRHFHHFAAQPLDQEQDFGVEAKARRPLQLERAARGGATKEFQAALRVLDFESRQEAHENVETASGKLSIARLMDADQASFEHARADPGIRT